MDSDVCKAVKGKKVKKQQQQKGMLSWYKQHLQQYLNWCQMPSVFFTHGFE